ncbi:MAG: hypothetical protein RIQ56_789 [Candidatus Parcubacteria bacterium]|jgi:nucleoside-diphosphate-sugar epimerase
MEGSIHVVTGASGFIGRHLVRSLLEQGENVFAVLRTSKQMSAEERGRAMFGSEYSNLTIVEGDVLKPFFGITEVQRGMLKDVDVTLWHLAADLSFSPSRQSVAEQTNRDGTKNAVEFANMYAERLIHMSTAYVCGDAAQKVFERRHVPRPIFRNHYERSKYEGEEMVHEKSAVPTIVARPSIVIGDAYEGKAEGCTFGYYRFAFMLHILKSWVQAKLEQGKFAGRLLRLMGTKVQDGRVRLPWLLLPYPANGEVDLVHIDNVVEPLIKVAKKWNQPGVQVLHITQRQSARSLFVMEAALDDLGIEGAKYLKLSPGNFHGLLSVLYVLAFPIRKYAKSVFWYIPYVVRPYVFDRTHAVENGIDPPPLTRDALRKINAYAQSHIFPNIDIDRLM